MPTTLFPRFLLVCLCCCLASTPALADTRLGNGFLELRMDDKGAMGMLTTSGDPNNPDDDDKRLLYHEGPQAFTGLTSFASTYVDGKIDIMGLPVFGQGAVTVPDQLTGDGKGITMTMEIEEVSFTQTIRFTDEVSGREDTCAFVYAMTNTSTGFKEVGLRIMLDTMVGDNDAAPINIAGKSFSLMEQEYTGTQLPQLWYALEGDVANPGMTVQGTLSGFGATPPNRFGVALYRNVSRNAWDWTANPSTAYAYPNGSGDSAVVLYYEPVVLFPGQTWEVMTYYGLTTISSCESNLDVSLVAPTYFKTTCLGQNPFPVEVQLTNTQATAIQDLQVSLRLEDGLVTQAGSSHVLEKLSPLAPGEIRNISYPAMLDGSRAGNFALNLAVTGTGGFVCSTDRSISVTSHQPCSPTPTPTGGATATPTPDPASQPALILGGYMTTNVSTSTGGAVTLVVVGGKALGLPEIGEVNLYYSGENTGFQLTDTGNEVFQLSLNMPAGLPAGGFLMELLGRVGGGNPRNTGLWPYLNVR